MASDFGPVAKQIFTESDMRENLLGSSTYQGRDGKRYPMPTWKKLGFLACPTLVAATGLERLFRVWSNPGAEMGRFFSRTAYRTRSEAERHSNVMQYGNGILFQAQFRVLKNTPMWVGNVHPGDLSGVLDTVAGSQIFIDWDFLKGNVSKISNLPLFDDMRGSFVIDNPDRGQLNS